MADYEITQKGVNCPKLKKELEVGTVITVKGDGVPAWLVNKVRAVKSAPVKTKVTNPKKNGDVDDAELKQKEALVEELKGLGVTANTSWKLETLQAKRDALVNNPSKDEEE